MNGDLWPGRQFGWREDRRRYPGNRLPRASRARRPGSGPFLSGDTFRGLAEVIVERGRWFQNRTGIRNLLFAEADEINQSQFRRKCENWVSENNWTQPQLVIHNGDRKPLRSSLLSLRETFDQIYAANFVDEIDGVQALPIGLENAHLRKNGVVRVFDKAQKLAARSRFQRPRTVGVSFNVRTNRMVREPAKAAMLGAGWSFQEPSMSPADYVKWVQETKFIISPPGNGDDCHRTWEAVYLGAVPVVLKSALHPDLIRDAPILAVESYEEFAERSCDDLDKQFLEISQRDRRIVHIEHWSRKFIEHGTERI